MNTQIITIIALIVGILGLITSAITLYWLIKIEKTRKNFYAGEDSVNLEQILSLYATKLKNLEAEQGKLEKELTRIVHNANFSIQKMAVKKFNTFGDSGGNLSFSLALLDQSNSGFVLTSMFGREQNRIYTKLVVEGTPTSSLTAEEQEAVDEAIKNWKTKFLTSAN